MLREAESKNRQDDLDFLEEHQPTWGSLADSWSQMPDHVRNDLAPGLDHTSVTNYISSKPADEFI